MNTKTINQMDLQVGNIVHTYGARFEVTGTYLQKDQREKNSGDVMVAISKWLDGHIEPGYFGPAKAWNIQGNKNVTQVIEC